VRSRIVCGTSPSGAGGSKSKRLSSTTNTLRSTSSSALVAETAGAAKQKTAALPWKETAECAWTAAKLAQGLPRSCPNSPPGTVGLRRKPQAPPLGTFSTTQDSSLLRVLPSGAPGQFVLRRLTALCGERTAGSELP
jgi:hypothetical protein